MDAKPRRGATWYLLRHLRSEGCRHRAADRFLAIVVAEHMGPKGEAYMSIETLRKQTSLATTRIKKGLDVLVNGDLKRCARPVFVCTKRLGQTAIFTLRDDLEPRLKEAAPEARHLASQSTGPDEARDDLASPRRDRAALHGGASLNRTGTEPQRGHNPLLIPSEDPLGERTPHARGLADAALPLNGNRERDTEADRAAVLAIMRDAERPRTRRPEPDWTVQEAGLARLKAIGAQRAKRGEVGT